LFGVTDEQRQRLLERRARREARRAKQRATNLLRAEAMHAARLAYEREPISESPGQKNDTSPTGTRLFVGCSGWYYWHWRDTFYPPGTPSSGWFPHYATQFDTVELNAPFYAWPTVATVKTWLRQAEGRPFVYTVKVCELITHVKRFVGTRTLVRDFGHIADLLGDRMGCFLFQLPPSYRYAPARLKTILAQLDPARRNVVEFRHKSWWNDRVYDAFRQAGAIFCSCSGPRLPDELVRTADDVYVRFHGTTRWYRHDYTTAELQTWVDRIRASGAKRVWAYFNNDREGYATKNARELIRLLEQGRRMKAEG
jgi:uncharacterized protein YecE (DUF72 family)